MDRKLLTKVLTKAGVKNEFLQAKDGEEGIEILSQNFQDICLILLDWQMPKVDGIGFMKNVIGVEQVAAIPIVMITASGSDDNKKLAYDTNPNLAGYVVKPYDTQALLVVVKPFLE